MIYRFCGYSLDTDRLELRTGKDQQTLEPQVFNLLTYLLQNRDRVVDKEEIIENIWQGRIVSDGTINSRINSVRRAVGDTGAAQAVIKTFPRRGFRFVAEVEESDGEKSPARGDIPTHEKPSIAVLPFGNMSGDPEQEYFSDGIAEDLITALSRFQWFFVIARNSSFSYKGTSPDVRDVGRDLGVQYVLEGSVRRVGSHLRITAQLIEAATGHSVWAERYDRDLDNIFAVQDEITEAIAGAVAPSFVSAEARRVERKQPRSFDSWDHAVRGNYHLWRLGRDNLAEARRLFGEAVEMDSNSSFALSGLALACSWQRFWGWAENPVENRAIAHDAAQRAVALDGDDAWAHAALSIVTIHRGEYDAAIRAARRALDLNPSLALAESAIALALSWTKGEYDQALVHSDRASRLSPRDPAQVWWILPRVIAAFVAERYEEQVEWARRITETTPDHPVGWRFLAAGYAELDQIEEAQAALHQYLGLVPHHTIKIVRDTVATNSPDLVERLLNGLRIAGLPE